MLRGTEFEYTENLCRRTTARNKIADAGDYVVDVLMEDGSRRKILLDKIQRDLGKQFFGALTDPEMVQAFDSRHYVSRNKELVCPPKLQCNDDNCRWNWFHSNCFFLTRQYVQTLQSKGVNREKYWDIDIDLGYRGYFCIS
jgi:hypothetical protein